MDNEYPWTSFFVFLGMYIIMDLIATTIANIFLFKSKSNQVKWSMTTTKDTNNNSNEK
jgi:hypothetical protein